MSAVCPVCDQPGRREPVPAKEGVEGAVWHHAAGRKCWCVERITALRSTGAVEGLNWWRVGGGERQLELGVSV